MAFDLRKRTLFGPASPSTYSRRIALSNYCRAKFVHTTHLVCLWKNSGIHGIVFDLWTFDLSCLLKDLLESAPVNDHQRGRDLIGLAHRTNFYPDRKLPLDAIKPFLLSFYQFFFRIFVFFVFTLDRDFWSLATFGRVLQVHRLRESRSAIRMKAFLKAVSYLCRCPHYGATRREHSSSSSACLGPNNDAPLWT